MRNNYLLRKIGGVLLAGLLLLPGSALFFNSQTVQAQRRVVIVRPIRPFRPFRPYGYRFGSPYGYNRYYNQYVFSSSEAAENQGYHDGLKTGSEDGRKGKSYDPERSHYFHDSGFGNFAEAYRNGFLRGYENGYRA